MPLDPDDLNAADEEIIRFLEDGRCTPNYLADELDHQQPYISQRLKRLVEHGHVDRLTRGLYELADNPLATVGRERAIDFEPDIEIDRSAIDPDIAVEQGGVDDDLDRVDQPDVQDAVADLAVPGSGDVAQRRRRALARMYDLLQEEGSATKQDFLERIDSDAVGYKDAAVAWACLVKGQDTLSALPGVDTPRKGANTWRYEAE